MTPPHVEQSSSNASTGNLAALDDEMGKIADSSAFILGDRFQEADGMALVRLLADAGWPSSRYTRSWGFAIEGDNSSAALRSLQRKYHAALLALERERDR